MAARATWKGFLKISLVHIPIKVFPATESSAAVSFHQLHATCQTRLQQRRHCATCAREVPNAEIVKGYEFERGRFVLLSADDFDQVRPESTRVINLVQFAAAGELDPMHVDRTYYLAPDGDAGAAYAVIRAAMKGKVGIGKLALYGREYLVAVRPGDGRELVMHTLHHAAEIRSIDAIDELRTAVTVDTSELKLARDVIAAFDAPLDLETFTDDYRAGLQTIIDAKIAGKEIVDASSTAAPQVVNLREALTKSLAAIGEKKKTAKAAPRRLRKAG
jgi:DNA end-binding protein Ku